MYYYPLLLLDAGDVFFFNYFPCFQQLPPHSVYHQALDIWLPFAENAFMPLSSCILQTQLSLVGHASVAAHIVTENLGIKPRNNIIYRFPEAKIELLLF